MDLQSWVAHWSSKYPDPGAEDGMLREFRGVDHLTRPQAEKLINWKFQTDARRRKRTHNLFAAESDERIKKQTERAFAAENDYAALLACQSLKGLGPATASVFLMAQAPDRYTVIDSRALNSMRALGRLPPGDKYAGVQDWGPYLGGCRKIVEETGCTLRVIDRAMYAANGRLECPDGT